MFVPVFADPGKGMARLNQVEMVGTLGARSNSACPSSRKKISLSYSQNILECYVEKGPREFPSDLIVRVSCVVLSAHASWREPRLAAGLQSAQHPEDLMPKSKAKLGAKKLSRVLPLKRK